jgi:hypothetical protein
VLRMRRDERNYPKDVAELKKRELESKERKRRELKALKEQKSKAA